MTARLHCRTACRRQGRADRPRRLLVVDFTRVVAGSACTQTLADFGAEGSRSRTPEGGDDTRAYEHAESAARVRAYISLTATSAGSRLILPSLLRATWQES